MSEPADGRACVRRMLAGDADGLRRLYEQYSASVCALANRILRNRSDAEEIVQDTFLEAWQRCDRYDESRGHVSTWLLTIARSRAIDRLRVLRSARGIVSLENVAALERVTGTRRPPRLGAADHELALRQSLDAVPAPQRIAVELSFLQGYSHPEIAILLRLPLGTIKTRVRLGLIKLRDAGRNASSVSRKKPRLQIHCSGGARINDASALSRRRKSGGGALDRRPEKGGVT